MKIVKLALILTTIFLQAGCQNTISQKTENKMHVYLLIGQSNMAGRAPFTEEESGAIERCYLLNGEDKWEPATNPFNRYSTIRKGLGMQKMNPGYTFAKAMAAKDKDIFIGLVVNAKGGTKIDQWKKGTGFYNEALRRTKIAQSTGILKGILWHQGEGNRGDSKYLEKLKTLIKDFRADLGTPELAFVAGQVRDIDDTKIVNDQIAMLPDNVPFTGVAGSKGLKTMDRWHFDAESMRLLGQRYAAAMLKIQNKPQIIQKNVTDKLTGKDILQAPGKKVPDELILPANSENKKTQRENRAKLTIPTVDKKDIICFAPYTVGNNILKMTAQLYPLAPEDSRTVRLEINKGGKWTWVATSTVDESDYGIGDGTQRWTASFRVENWDSTKDFDYRLAHGKDCYYTGRIRKDPVDKETIVVAAFTGNSNRDRSQKPDIIANIKAHDPDLLFFSGDQSYDHKKHLAAWLLFGRQFGEIIRDRPTVAIPDDHDIGQGNLWGAGGKVSKTSAGHDGGYFHPAQYVKSVENAQTGNLPDPYDPTPILRGIRVYYTSLNIGGVDFAIIEDRKFKSGPDGLVPKMGPRPDHVNDPDYDPKTVDVAGAKLLGERQLKFLSEWGKDWDGVEMKAVLSQTVFANAAHIHKGNRLIADMDSNGWPQSGRNRAVDEIRRSFSLMIGGDQHLATVIHHGIDDFNDAGFSFCVPSIVNYYPRQWMPLVKGVNPVSDKLDHTGSYLDGFGNHLTMYAYANPYEGELNYPKWREQGRWGKLAAGHGIIRFNKTTRKITMECWPRGVDVTKKDAKQFPGWPITIDQLDNFGKKAVAYLPTIKVSGMTMPVIQVIDESSKQVIYTLRIKGDQFRPKVFAEGTYTVIVGDQRNKIKKLKGLKSLAAEDREIIQVVF